MIVVCDPYNPSLGFLEDISLAQIYRAELNSLVFLLISFVANSLNETGLHELCPDEFISMYLKMTPFSRPHKDTIQVVPMILSDLISTHNMFQLLYARTQKNTCN